MTADEKGEASKSIRTRVVKARKVQQERFGEANNKVYSNAMMSSPMVKKLCKLDQPSKILLKTAMERLNLSSRAYDRILKVSRTIADLAASESIKPEHIAEAIQYRSLDREGWGMN